MMNTRAIFCLTFSFLIS
ncbi:hypothetical protein CISIN_1g0260371mg, partial [Citrus sinensis]